MELKVKGKEGGGLKFGFGFLERFNGDKISSLVMESKSAAFL